MANVLSPDKKAAVISALVEGCSINSIVRMTGVAKWTILRPAMEAGISSHVWSIQEIASLMSVKPSVLAA